MTVAAPALRSLAGMNARQFSRIALLCTAYAVVVPISGAAPVLPDQRDRQVLETMLLHLLADTNFDMTRISTNGTSIVLHARTPEKTGFLMSHQIRSDIGSHTIPSDAESDLRRRNTPPDAKPGSKFAPWFKLTEYEMAVLRKQMKKNAIWSPSDTMIRRELQKKGRGRENYEREKTRTESTGEPLLDEEAGDRTNKKGPLAPGEISSDTWGKEDSQLVNRGMKLNEAKKLKKESLLREQAMRDAMEIEDASRKVMEAGNMMKNLFFNHSTRDSVTVTPISEKKKETPKSVNKKRRREQTPDAPPSRPRRPRHVRPGTTPRTIRHPRNRAATPRRRQRAPPRPTPTHRHDRHPTETRRPIQPRPLRTDPLTGQVGNTPYPASTHHHQRKLTKDQPIPETQARPDPLPPNCTESLLSRNG